MEFSCVTFGVQSAICAVFTHESVNLLLILDVQSAHTFICAISAVLVLYV